MKERYGDSEKCLISGNLKFLDCVYDVVKVLLDHQQDVVENPAAFTTTIS